MKKRLNLFLTFLLLSPFIYSQNKVLIIGIDGCRPDALQQANTPNIDQFLSNSIYSWDALNDGITISGPVGLPCLLVQGMRNMVLLIIISLEAIMKNTLISFSE